MSTVVLDSINQPIPIALQYPYPYTRDLLALEASRPAVPLTIPAWLSKIVTPLKWEAWTTALAEHPDKDFQHYICQGIRSGFRLGFDYGKKCEPVRANMKSALSHPEPLSDYLTGECLAERVVGPLPQSAIRPLQVSRLGVIPKSTPGKWRVILDLSSPEGKSVNDGVPSELCHLQLASVDDAIQHIVAAGPQAQLAKLDIAQAYRNIPVHPQDRWLLGMEWQQKLYIDTVLPFGLRSAPKIFCAISDALEWVLHKQQVSCTVKYIDDFLLIGQAGTSQCQQNVKRMIKTCEELGIPLAAEKLLGPTTILTFLGIELDTTKMEVRLPSDKLHMLQATIEEWAVKRSCRKRNLESLIGQLAHASKVNPSGRAFLRRLIDLAKKPRLPNHWVRLNEEARSDIEWWRLFISRWNGISMIMPRVANPRPDIVVHTDASGWGCGGVWNDEWFQYQWPQGWDRISIAVKELVPVVLACCLWGPLWFRKWVLIRTDNLSVVEVLTKRSSKDSRMMQLVRGLQFILATLQFELWVQHIPGSQNIAADAISRNILQVLQEVAPQTSTHPTVISQLIESTVVTQRPDWLSPSWRRMLADLCNWV